MRACRRPTRGWPRSGLWPRSFRCRPDFTSAAVLRPRRTPGTGRRPATPFFLSPYLRSIQSCASFSCMAAFHSPTTQRHFSDVSGRLSRPWGVHWAEHRPAFHRYLKRLVEGGFAKRIMFGSDQMVWPDAIARSLEAYREADYLTPQQRRTSFSTMLSASSDGPTSRPALPGEMIGDLSFGSNGWSRRPPYDQVAQPKRRRPLSTHSGLSAPDPLRTFADAAFGSSRRLEG